MTFPRQRVEEWMDAPDLDPQRHRRALAGLRRLNRISGVSTVVYGQLTRLAKVSTFGPLKVLDVASGSGDLPIDWLRWAKRQRIAMHVTALDRSGVALATAADRSRQAGVELRTVQRDCLSEGLPTGFDVVTCSLFMHHLDEPDAVRLLREMWRVSRRSVIICDLDRSRLNLALIAAASHLVTRSDVVHFDATASVRGAFTRAEFARVIEQAIGVPYPVHVSLPCRFLAVMDQSCEIQWATGLEPRLAGAMA